MFREGGTHPQEHRREDAMVVASGDVGRYARKISCALCAARGHACGTERKAATCSVHLVPCQGRACPELCKLEQFSGLWQAGGKGFGSVTLRFLLVSEAQHEIPELKIVRLVPFLVKFIEVQLHGTRMFKGRSIDIPPSHLDRLEPPA